MTITYWSDYACPFCYIGETNMKTALKNLGIKDEVPMTMRAFELNPEADRNYTGDTVTRFAVKYGLSKEGAAQRIEGISNMGREAGLTFNYAQTRYTNTRDAHRLTKAAQKLGDDKLVHALSEALFKAYFADSKELADHKVLAEIAASVGMDEAVVKDVLSSNKYDDEVEMDEREAMMRGVHGVPFFIISGKYALNGAAPAEELEKMLKQVYDEEKEAEKKTSNLMEGMTCGPEGCSIADHRAQMKK